MKLSSSLSHHADLRIRRKIILNQRVGHMTSHGRKERVTSSAHMVTGKSDSLKIFDINDTLLTAQQLADRLNVSLKTIRKWRYERVMPADCMTKIGSRLVRYRWVNVRRWLQLEGD